jgi:hypothetical protein
MKRWFHRVILSRHWLSFVTLVVSFFVFGIGSLNLFYVARANFGLIARHGWQALMDGGAQQLLEVLVTGFVIMVAYVVLKACEASLVRGLLDPPVSAAPVTSEPDSRSAAPPPDQ